MYFEKSRTPFYTKILIHMTNSNLEIIDQNGSTIIVAPSDLGIYKWDEAQEECLRLNNRTKSQWRLPTPNELVLMYTQLHENGLGDFKSQYYWSSEEVIEQEFNSANWPYDQAPILPNPYSNGCEFEFFGHIASDNKNFEHIVRLVREQ